MDLWSQWAQTDGVGRLVAVLLLAMSVSSWVVILYKLWWLRSASAGVALAVPAFWQSANWAQAMQALPAADAQGLALPLVQAAHAVHRPTAVQAPSLGGSAHQAQQLTRVLRDALIRAQQRLQFGHVLLATVGATAPFVGLLGTVWGIYHALLAMGGDGPVTLDQVATPVGEALVMTAAGLAVAIPAVLAYNTLGRAAARTEAALEAFAHDLREWVLQSPQAH